MSRSDDKAVENGRHKILIEGTRKFFLAGLGAMLLAQEELGNLTDKLVQKGESTEEKSRQRFQKFIKDRRQQSRKRTKRVETNLNRGVEEVLHRLSIPTSSEINSLNRKITRLTKKVDELNKA